MKLVLASKNTHKLEELRAILSAQGVEVLLESDVGVDLEVEETGTTFEENALLKARAVMEATGLPAVADDSGRLCRPACHTQADSRRCRAQRQRPPCRQPAADRGAERCGSRSRTG